MAPLGDEKALRESLLPEATAFPHKDAPVSKSSTAELAPQPDEEDDLPDELDEEEIQRRLDQADDVHIEVMNEAALKRMSAQFERKIKRNQEMRIKHCDEPDKFLKSEVDLDEEVKKFSILATHPDLYGEFIESGTLPVLVNMLNHANTDIAMDVFDVLSDLTDPDVVSEVEEPEKLLQALFDAQLCEMSIDVLARINEDASEEELKAVTNCLTVFENLTGIDPQASCERFVKVPKLLPWLIKRVRAAGDVDYNRMYASELLGIILQTSKAAREVMVKLEGVDKLLRGIAVYRKRDPVNSEESEYVQNMFDCLCSLMLLKKHQIAFGNMQGLELMIRMMREHNFSSNLALRLSDHALRHCPENCQVYVDKLGLKVLFAMFMKKGPRVKTKAAVRENEEHVVSVLQSLCRYCTGIAVARLLNKFTENSFEKLERLLEMHEEYAASVRDQDQKRLHGEMEQIDRELEVDDEEQLYLDRCDAGLFTLQQVGVVIVRLANMGNRQVAEEMSKLLDMKGVPLQAVSDTVWEYCRHLDLEAAKGEADELMDFISALAKRCGMQDSSPAVLKETPDRIERTPKSSDEAEKAGPSTDGDANSTEKLEEKAIEKSHRAKEVGDSSLTKENEDGANRRDDRLKRQKAQEEESKHDNEASREKRSKKDRSASREKSKRDRSASREKRTKDAERRPKRDRSEDCRGRSAENDRRERKSKKEKSERRARD